MGLPEIQISFHKKAQNIINQSTRGMVALLVDDATKDQVITPYRSVDDVIMEDWTEQTSKVLKLVFKGGPQKVLVIRAVKKESGVDLSASLALIKAVNFDYLAYPDFKGEDKEVIKKWLQEMRVKGKKAKAVLPECDGDYEAIINYATPSVTAKWPETGELVTYTAAEYCARIAGVLAGLPLTQSATNYELKELVDAELAEDPDAEIDAGKLIVVFDGEKYKLGRGVTSLVTLEKTTPKGLQKIKIVEGQDILKHDIYTTFDDEYSGKLVNDYDNKQLFIGAVLAYYKELYGTILDGNSKNEAEIDIEANRKYLKEQGKDVDDLSEQELKEANTGSYLYLAGGVTFLDAMEDLNMNIAM